MSEDQEVTHVVLTTLPRRLIQTPEIHEQKVWIRIRENDADKFRQTLINCWPNCLWLWASNLALFFQTNKDQVAKEAFWISLITTLLLDKQNCCNHINALEYIFTTFLQVK